MATLKQKRSTDQKTSTDGVSKRKNFSGFNLKEAFKQLKLREIQPWEEQPAPAVASDFFRERLARLQRHFDLETCEESKKLLIDAVCEEALEGFDNIKVWKGANLESPTTSGVADYLIAERKGYLEAPFLCIIEAKKDDFEQGLAQCLVEMQACQWENQQVDRTIETLGIVSNGNAWAFYRLTIAGEVYKTELYALTDLGMVLGWLKHVFQRCETNLAAG
ncbi:MAG: hypothetical protein HC860_09615 [Alkalinema sp. RU_4_3]|nr:hypothetical protein [Alkalinema sp. RU_4_3]